MRLWLPSLLLAIAAGAAAGVACDDPSLPGPSTGGGGSSSEPSDLPCDVARTLNESCVMCHADPPRGGANVPLVTRAHLLAPALSNPEITLAEDALARMRNGEIPMPPTGLLDDSAIAPLEKWIADGMPAVVCDDELVPPDDPYDTPLVCTSARFWTDGDEGDEEMHPGRACIQCHDNPDKYGEGDDDDDDDDEEEEEEEEEEDDDIPRYLIAGTVYPTAHEPDECYGVDSATTYVVVEDANGTTRTLATNEAGNFFTEDALVAPYRVKVIRGDETRAMSELAEHGDCNLCHTVEGDEDAPGRIMAP